MSLCWEGRIRPSRERCERLWCGLGSRGYFGRRHGRFATGADEGVRSYACARFASGTEQWVRPYIGACLDRRGACLYTRSNQASLRELFSFLLFGGYLRVLVNGGEKRFAS